MSRAENFFFMLPKLIEKGLLYDDSSHYAFLSYPKDLITQVTILIFEQYIIENWENISISSKKKIKIIMEFNAIALSVEIENVKMMETARNIYQSWINNKLQIFGNEKKRQIKYLRRIITQLSLPFSINKPKTVSTFKNNFMELLHTILDDYEKIALQLDIMGNNV